MDAAAFVTIVASLFAIVNPLGAIPPYVALTQGYSLREKRRVIAKAVVVGCGVLLAFGVAGERIFDVFDVTIPAFRIAGGILIFVVALDMLQGQRPKTDATEGELEEASARRSSGGADGVVDDEDRIAIGVTPLGVPLLTGPGAITTIIVLTASYGGAGDRLLIFGAAVLVFVASWLLLAVADRVLARVGRGGLLVLSRVMGLLLAAIAVEFVLRGLAAVAPALFSGVA